MNGPVWYVGACQKWTATSLQPDSVVMNDGGERKSPFRQNSEWCIWSYMSDKKVCGPMGSQPVRRMDGQRPKDMGWKHMDGYIQIGTRAKDLHITY